MCYAICTDEGLYIDSAYTGYDSFMKGFFRDLYLYGAFNKMGCNNISTRGNEKRY